MSYKDPKRYWHLVQELKELDSKAACGGCLVSSEEWLKDFSNFLFNDKLNKCSQLESRIKEMMSCSAFSD